MQSFRNLTGNIFFKILLSFVALTFVLFGVSEFILGSPNSWVAKIGNTTIGLNAFNKALKNDRDLISASNKSEEALQYMSSEQFKTDVLRRLVNKTMIEKLHNELGVEASRQLILEGIATDPNFRNVEGKFDHNLFQNFLSNNGLNEERYVNEVASNVTANMIIQTLSLVSPLDDNSISEVENFQQERRFADVVTISTKSLNKISRPNKEEINEFFTKNSYKYSAPEMREVSYLHFSKKDFAKDFKISDAEIKNEYEQNSDKYVTTENRDFYHIIFDEEEAAKSFVQELDKSKKNSKSTFVKLAKKIQEKSTKAITLNNITKKDLIPELLKPTFDLTIGEYSQAVESPLGFHVFLLNKINKSQPIAFSEAKNIIKETMLRGREEKVMQEKISAIDDLILTSNSLTQTAKEFGLEIKKSPLLIDKNGNGKTGKPISEIKILTGFADNSFALDEKQASQIFYTASSDEFYALKVEQIIETHERKLSEVKSQVIKDLTKITKSKALQDLAKKIENEINKNPRKAANIAAKYKVKFKKNREFSQKDKTNLYLFNLKIGQATPALFNDKQEFTIKILRKIKPVSINSLQLNQAKKKASSDFKNEIMQEYDRLLMIKNPVKVNEQFFSQQNSAK